MNTRKKAELRLGNGRVLEGWSFGYDGPATGEVVFSTSMVGYPESLTDPVIDNLLKGASGQAVQNMNLLFSLPETAGLRLKASAF